MPATHRRLASDFLTPAECRALRVRSTLKGMGLIIHAWVVVFAAMAIFALYPNPLTFLAALFIIGGRQLGLSVLMHDAAHGALLNDRARNERLGQWLCAWPVGLDLHLYRTYHLKHHARTQQSDDPDLVLSAPFPTTRRSMIRKVLRDLTGRTGLKQRYEQVQAAINGGGRDQTLSESIANFRVKLGGIILSNLILFVLLFSIGHWYLYPVLWLLPLLTTYQLVLRVRNIAEHAMVPDNDNPLRNARTVHANWLERAIVAPYWVNYHVEHHLLFWVPCYNLPKLHHFLKSRSEGAMMEEMHGYRSVLKMVASLSDDEDKRGSRIHNEERTFSGIIMETKA